MERPCNSSLLVECGCWAGVSPHPFSVILPCPIGSSWIIWKSDTLRRPQVRRQLLPSAVDAHGVHASVVYGTLIPVGLLATASLFVHMSVEDGPSRGGWKDGPYKCCGKDELSLRSSMALQFSSYPNMLLRLHTYATTMPNMTLYMIA